MNITNLTNIDELAILKSAYFEALEFFNNSYTEEALSKLIASEDAYMSLIKETDIDDSSFLYG